MSTAQKFIDQLREGNTTEAIKTIQEAMYEKSAESIDETRQQVLESYGFSIVEKKKEKYDEKMEYDDEEEDEEDDKEGMDEQLGKNQKDKA